MVNAETWLIINMTNLYHIFLIVTFLIAPIHAYAKNQKKSLIPYAKIQCDHIVESSGLVKSRKYPGVYWTHNDSGDSARIFAITEYGKIIKPEWCKGTYEGIAIIDAFNIDWEDIATNSEGTLIIGDFGNNWNLRDDLCLYVIKEPNPYEDVKTSFIKKIPFAYPEQRNYHSKKKMDFDAEALFVKKGKYYILTKNRGNKKTRLYVLDERDDIAVTELRLVGTFNVNGLVTGADVSDDGKRLVVLTYNSVWLFEIHNNTDDFFKGKIYRYRFTSKKLLEGITCNNGEVIISDESNNLYRLNVKEFSEITSEKTGRIPPSVEHRGLLQSD